MTWTHEGKPIGQPQKPWRITRAQRVEMEAALINIRTGLVLAQDLNKACGLLGWRTLCDSLFPTADGARPRILRARVAIALRAALRADEDARCEDALRRTEHGDEVETLREMCEWPAMRRRWVYVRLSDDEIRALPLSMCSWKRDDSLLKPGFHTVPIDEPVPLALWEIDERRRHETLRAVVALLTWGLS